MNDNHVEWPDPAADSLEDIIEGLCMNGVIGDGGLLPNSWIVCVDVGDNIRLYVDRHSKGYATIGMAEFIKELVMRSEFGGADE